MHPLALTDNLRSLTAHITAYRFQLENERSERRKLMAIEIKGLKAKALAARANLDKLSQAYDRFNEMAPAHAADVIGLTEQVTGMQSDLEFASTLMGNSVGESEKLAEKQVVTSADVGKLNGETIVAQPAAIPTPPPLTDGSAPTASTSEPAA